MISYSATNVFPKPIQLAHERAGQIVEAIPDVLGLRCHEVSRIVHGVLGHPRVDVLDGKYGPSYALKLGPQIDHSWLTILSVSPVKMFILDVYAIGRLPMVQLIDVNMGLGAMYHPVSGERPDIKTTLVADVSRNLRTSLESWRWKWD